MFTLAGLAIAVSSSFCHAAKTVPFSSELGTPYGFDPEWTNSRGDGPKAWSAIKPENWEGEWGDTGCSSAIQYVYATTDADAWYISPAIELAGGKDYTLTVWVRTEYFPESFRVNLAEGATVAALKAGTTIIDLNNRTITGRWKPLRSTFRVNENGEYHFGLNCYSEADMMNLYVTGFSLLEGDGSHDIKVNPAENPVIKQLPYQSDIANDHTSWSTIIGSRTTASHDWYYEPADNSYSFVSYDNIEDNWLISPALEFASAGDYRISVSADIYGSLDVYLGTDPAKPETFTVPVTGNTDIPAGDTPGSAMVEIKAPGKYYVGFHAHSEEGSAYGYGITSLYVREYKNWPQPVRDLATGVDPNGLMDVSLQWTNPSLTVKGDHLQNLEKVELYRDGELVATITDVVPGKVQKYVDRTVTTPGIHIYHVLPYNELGAAEDGVQRVSTMYVGAGVEAFPYRMSYADDDAASEFAKWYAYNPAGVPDREWHMAFGWRYYWESRQLHNNGVPYANDDYLATPYISLAKGYYKVSFEVNDRHADYDFGYLTDRADMPGTFVKAQEFRNSEMYASHTTSVVVYIPADGNYALAWHRVGANETTSGVEIYGIDMEEVQSVPALAENLTVTPAEGFRLSAEISWKNPSTDNAGMPLEEITRITLLRNGEAVNAELNLTPGAEQTIIDTDISGDGEYTYEVTVFNDNGALAVAPPSATVYVGKAATAPWQPRLWDWKIVNMDGSREKWRRYGEGSLVFSTNFSDADDWVISPFVSFEPDSRYEVAIETYLGGEDPVTWALARGNGSNPATMTYIENFTTYETKGQTDKVILTTVEADDKVQEQYPDVKAVYVPVGTYTLGVHGYLRGTFELRSFAVNKLDISGIANVAIDSDGAIVLADGNIILPANTAAVRVYDAQGRCVMSRENVGTIATDELPSGIVMVNAIGADGSMKTAKFVF